MRKLLLSAAATVAFTSTAPAEPLSPNDIPGIISALRNCGTMYCSLGDGHVWFAIEDGAFTIFYVKDGGYGAGATLTGHGSNVQKALQELASKIVQERKTDKEMLDRMSQFLPTQ